jgi:hypothetical protein
MAGLGLESGMSAISALAGWDKKKYKPIYLDKNLKATQDLLTADLNRQRDKNYADLDSYDAAFNAGTSRANELAQDDQNRLTDILNSLKGYDPMASYERTRSGNLDALNGWAKNLADYGSRADKLSLLSRGYGGRATDGGYGTALRTNSIATSTVPVLNTIFGNLGRDSAIAEQNRFNNLLESLDIMKNRAATVDRPAERLLMPIQARTGTLNDEIASLAGLTSNAKNNTAGWQSETSQWDRALRALGRSGDELGDTAISEFNTLAGMALSAYSPGGMMGGVNAGAGGYQAGGGSGGMFGLGGRNGYLNQMPDYMQGVTWGQSTAPVYPVQQYPEWYVRDFGTPRPNTSAMMNGYGPSSDFRYQPTVGDINTNFNPYV